MKPTLALLAGATALLAACNNSSTDNAKDQVGSTAEATTAVAEPAPGGAFGLTEAQILDADLLGTDGTARGDIVTVVRAHDGRVTGLLVKVEDSDPERFVEIPAQGLVVLTRGDSTDLVTTRTAADFDALPAATLPAATPAPTSSPTT